MSEQKAGIQSVETAIDILYTFRTSRAPMSLTSISQMTGVPKGNLHKYLVSLIRKGMVKQDKGTLLYSLGPAVLELGMWELSSLDPDAIYDEHVQKIALEIGQSAALALWQESGPIIVKYKKSNRPINIEMQLGYRPSPVISATGKCFMAFLPEESRQTVLAADNELDKQAFEQELEQIRGTGVSFRLEEYDTIPGSRAIAVPVFDHSGNIAAALSLIGFSPDFELKPDSAYVQSLKRHAGEISRKLMYQGEL